LEKYDISGSRQRHVAIIREHYGVQAADDVLARMSPYLTEHVNRFGNYTLTLDRACPLPDYQITVYDEEPELVPAR
jgi:hypothetical protein